MEEYQKEKEFLIKKVNQKEIDSNTERKIKELQKEIRNYKEIQAKYRKQCEDLTKRIFAIKEELLKYGQLYSKVKEQSKKKSILNNKE